MLPAPRCLPPQAECEKALTSQLEALDTTGEQLAVAAALCEASDEAPAWVHALCLWAEACDGPVAVPFVAATAPLVALCACVDECGSVPLALPSFEVCGPALRGGYCPVEEGGPPSPVNLITVVCVGEDGHRLPVAPEEAHAEVCVTRWGCPPVTHWLEATSLPADTLQFDLGPAVPADTPPPLMERKQAGRVTVTLSLYVCGWRVWDEPLRLSPGYAARGKFVGKIMTAETNNNSGFGFTRDGSHMVVANFAKQELTVYAFPGPKKVRQFGRQGTGQCEFSGAYKMVATREGHMIVAEDINQRLQEVTLEGKHVRFIGVGILDEPCMSVDTDDVVIVTSKCSRNNPTADRVYVLDYASGALLRKFCGLGSGPGNMGIYSGNIKITPDGKHAVVVDTSNNRLSRWRLSDGAYCGAYGEGVLNTPTDMGFTCDGNYVTTDNRNQRIAVLSSADGSLLSSFCREGNTDGNLMYPTCMNVFDGLLYVLDWATARVSVFT